MNPLDVVLASIIAYCLVRGIFRGLIKELSSIVGVLGGFYAAYSYYPFMAKYLSVWITKAAYANLVSCLLLFAGVYLTISLLGVLIKYLMNIVFLGWTDRLCGLLFGTIKGLLIVSVIVVPLTTFLPKNSKILKDSIIVQHTVGISALMVHVASADMKVLFKDNLKELKKTWERKTT